MDYDTKIPTVRLRPSLTEATRMWLQRGTQIGSLAVVVMMALKVLTVHRELVLLELTLRPAILIYTLAPTRGFVIMTKESASALQDGAAVMVAEAWAPIMIVGIV